MIDPTYVCAVIVQAYDASRLNISEVHADPDEKTIYSVASKAHGVRVQKAVDAEVAALLDDSDASRFGSDVEDLEEDFVVQANVPEPEEEDYTDRRLNINEQCQTNDVIDDEADVFNHTQIAAGFIPQDGIQAEAKKESAVEKPRVRRLLDEQFDLVSSVSDLD